MANMGAVRKYTVKDIFSLLKSFELAKVYSIKFTAEMP